MIQICLWRGTHSRICSRSRCRSCRRRCTARCWWRRLRRRRGGSSGPCGTACSCSLRRWAGPGTGTTGTGTRTRSGRPSRRPAGCWPTSRRREGGEREVKKRRQKAGLIKIHFRRKTEISQYKLHSDKSQNNVIMGPYDSP